MFKKSHNPDSNIKIGILLFSMLLLSANLVSASFLNVSQNSWMSSTCLQEEFFTSSSHVDSLRFTKVIIYRPDNRTKIKCSIRTNLLEGFDLARKEYLSIDAQSDFLEIHVNAFSHKGQSLFFPLAKDTVHYFRVQDRNNYAGVRPRLEVVEVTEETFRKDNPMERK